MVSTQTHNRATAYFLLFMIRLSFNKTELFTIFLNDLNTMTEKFTIERP